MTEMDFLWTQAGVEFEEHIEQIEPLLVSAEHGPLDDDSIGGLFRAFHSLKGLAKALDLLSLEATAHFCEDLLGLVRDEGIELSSLMVEYLIDAIDVIRDLKDTAINLRQDGERPQEVLDKLSELFQRLNVDAQDGDDDEGDVEILSVFDDPEMVQFFAEVVKDELPRLAGIIQPSISEGDSTLIIAALQRLSHASGSMEFFNLVTELDQMQVLIKESGQDNSSLDMRIARLANLASLIAIIEDSEEISAGTNELAEELQAPLQTQTLSIYSEIEEFLFPLKEAADCSGESYLNLAKGIRLLIYLCRLQKFKLCLDPLMLIDDLCSRISDQVLESSKHICQLIISNIELSQKYFKQFVKGDLDAGEATEHIQSNMEEFHAALTVSHGEEVDIGSIVTILLPHLTIHQELVDAISVENLEALEAAIDAGEHSYIIKAHLETDEKFASALLEWLASNVSAVTNRTVIEEGLTWFEMLVTSPLNSAMVAAQTAELNPSGCEFVRVLCNKESTSCAVPGITPVSAESKGNLAQEEKAASDPKPKKSVQDKKQVATEMTSYIRVAGATLDEFMNRIGEMVSTINMLEHVIADDKVRHSEALCRRWINNQNTTDTDRVSDMLDAFKQQNSRLRHTQQVLGTSLERLQESALNLRVVPMETVFRRFPRLVRDLSKNLKKEVKLDLIGGDVAIDKSMVDILLDPLIHMVRNSIDHGLEYADERESNGKSRKGVVTLKATQGAGQVEIEVSDDGRGMNPDKIAIKAKEKKLVTAAELESMSEQEVLQMIFLPGFSTADQVTDTSGRGVGMDVVRTNITRIGGTLELHSSAGKGSSVIIQLPLSVAIQETLLLKSGDQVFGIPNRHIEELIKVEDKQLQSVKGRQSLLLRNDFLPLLPLGNLLGVSASRKVSGDIVVISNGKHRVGLSVDKLEGLQELFMKEIHPQIASLPGVGGAAILPDGDVVLILDVEDIISLAKCFQDDVAA